MAAAPDTTLANFSFSIFIALSNGKSAPSLIASTVEASAGSMTFFFLFWAIILSKFSNSSLEGFPALFVCGLSHSWFEETFPSSILFFASFRSFSFGTHSSSKPIFSASLAVMGAPFIRMGSELVYPIKRGSLCVPPPPGIRPRVTSGSPSLRVLSSAPIL